LKNSRKQREFQCLAQNLNSQKSGFYETKIKVNERKVRNFRTKCNYKYNPVYPVVVFLESVTLCKSSKSKEAQG
jgi:hypothetical protein